MKKILFIGPEITDFINPLANNLKENGYTVDVLELRAILRNNDKISKSYSKILNFTEISGEKINTADVINYLFKKEFWRNLYKTILINSLEGKSRIIKSLKKSLKHQHTKKHFSHVFNNYDIINFHSLSPATISFVNHVEKDKKIILSFWGSDIYQTSGLENYYELSDALNKAKIITVLNYEMEKVVLSKFGSDLFNKIVHVRLGSEDKIFDLIDNSKNNRPDLNFLDKYNVPENKIRITVGYCGNLVCNHLLVLNELEKIEDNLKEKVHLLVPMTYGNYSAEYMNEVTLALERTSMSYTIFDKFLSIEELAKLRVNSDIMIHMNKSDGFSASVSEALYADNLLISAVWLPYSLLRLEKVFFYETDFVKLSETLTIVVSNYEKIKTNVTENPIKIKKISSFSQNFSPWIRIFDSSW